jgi:hypothetical protein
MRRAPKRRRPYYAAGVLVCMLLNNEAHVLLGADTQMAWSDFGGRSEYEDMSMPMATALRELDEETLCAVSPEFLSLEGKAIVSRTLSGQVYYMHVCAYTGSASAAAAIVDEHSAALSRTVGYVEKTSLRWFRWADILRALDGTELRDVFARTVSECRDQIELALSRLRPPRVH